MQGVTGDCRGQQREMAHQGVALVAETVAAKLDAETD